MFKKQFYIGLVLSLLVISNISKAQYVFEQLPFHDRYGQPTAKSIFVIDTFLYCTAEDGTHGKEPWISDGTMAGSKMVKDIFSGKNDSYPNSFTEYNNKVYFSANDGTNGIELWSTDGTANGTHLVKDIYPGVLFSNPGLFSEYNNKLYFSANDGTHGFELWITDGTTNGTQLFKDLDPGSADSRPSQFTIYNGKMFFTATGGLWETDGTTTGTHLATITSTGTSFKDIEILTLFNGKLYFTAKQSTVSPSTTTTGLWETDGTLNGTKFIKEASIENNEVIIFNNKMYFAGYDGSTANVGIELIASDGTATGTQLLKDINTTTRRSSHPEQFTVVDNQLFFVADDGVHGDEVWVTDGTTNGTKLVKDIMFDPSNPKLGSRPENLTSFNKKLFFVAKDTSNKDGFWISDGTANSTKKLIVYDRTNNFNIHHNDVPFIICNDALYFIANHTPSGGYTLWKMTDTTTTTNPPTSIKLQDDFSNDIIITPNPAHDNVHIALANAVSNAEIILTDISGKIVHRQMINRATKDIDFKLPKTTPGIYILNIQGSNSSMSKRLLIE